MQRKHNCNEKLNQLSNAFEQCTTYHTKQPHIVKSEQPTVLLLEPFFGGSHKQLMDLLIRNTKCTFIGLDAKKWPWRARCSAIVLSQAIPKITTEKTLFCSSVLNLAELLGLRVDLLQLKKIVYFHENQLVYPIRQIKDRDVQFAYNQIVTCLSADVILFNSQFNMNSLLDNIPKILKLLPDYRPQNLREQIEPKCRVLYFPVEFPSHIGVKTKSDVLTIVWPHRWEFDKAPEVFFGALFELKKKGYAFRVHVLGERFADVPDVFDEAKDKLADDILSFGYVADKETYYKILQECHVAVSTAMHEFFGVSMLEAVHCGCFPLVPNRLVYPEIYPQPCLYNDDLEMIKRLKEFAANVEVVASLKTDLGMDLSIYSKDTLLEKYIDVFH